MSGDEPPNDRLLAAFEADMEEIHVAAKREIRYNATRFLQLLGEHGGLGTAHLLLATDDIAYGFVEITLAGRPDLTVESLVLRREYTCLFSDDELRRARERLGLREGLERLFEAEWDTPTVAVLTGGRRVLVTTCLRSETRLPEPIERTACCWAPNKPTLEFERRPTWAEFILVRLLERAGWEGVWVKNWAGGREFCIDVDRRRELPEATKRLFGRIHARAENLRGGGTWDVLAWRGSEHVLVESKQRGSDALRESQIGFLEAAIGEGLRPSQFAIVEYEMRTAVG